MSKNIELFNTDTTMMCFAFFFFDREPFLNSSVESGSFLSLFVKTFIFSERRGKYKRPPWKRVIEMMLCQSTET